MTSKLIRKMKKKWKMNVGSKCSRQLRYGQRRWLCNFFITTSCRNGRFWLKKLERKWHIFNIYTKFCAEFCSNSLRHSWLNVHRLLLYDEWSGTGLWNATLHPEHRTGNEGAVSEPTQAGTAVHHQHHVRPEWRQSPGEPLLDYGGQYRGAGHAQKQTSRSR